MPAVPRKFVVQRALKLGMKPSQLVLLAVVALLALPASASADGPIGSRSLLDGQIRTSGAAGSCLSAPPRARPAWSSAARRRPAAASSPPASPRRRATGTSSIWDVLTKRMVAGSAGFGANELAEGFVGGGREVIVQACRRSGASTATLVVNNVPVPAGHEARTSRRSSRSRSRRRPTARA